MSRWARGPLLPLLSVAALLLLPLGVALLLRKRAAPAPVPCPLPVPDDTYAADMRWDSRPLGGAVPPQPLPNQKRPPCTPRREVEENGGCWVEMKVPPPCPEGTYEKSGTCLIPVTVVGRPPVSGSPQ